MPVVIAIAQTQGLAGVTGTISIDGLDSRQYHPHQLRESLRFVGAATLEGLTGRVPFTDLYQAGLGMPDRDYYVVDRFAPQKTAYEAYVGKILTLAGWPVPRTRAAQILAFETRIENVGAGDLTMAEGDPLLEQGCLLQLTAGAVAGHFGKPAQQRARELLENPAQGVLELGIEPTPRLMLVTAHGREEAFSESREAGIDVVGSGTEPGARNRGDATAHPTSGSGPNFIAWGVGATEYAALVYAGFTIVEVPEDVVAGRRPVLLVTGFI